MEQDLRAYSADEILRDGRSIHLRAIRPDDKTRLRDGFRRLSSRSVYLRFLGARRSLSDADLVRLAEVDFERHVSLVATLLDGGDERIVGVARYIRRDDEGAPTRAELAVTVADDHQGRGIASALLRRLAQIAHARGVKEFEADVLGDNGRMLRLLESSGFATRRSIESGVVHVILSTDATPG